MWRRFLWRLGLVPPRAQRDAARAQAEAWAAYHDEYASAAEALAADLLDWTPLEWAAEIRATMIWQRTHSRRPR